MREVPASLQDERTAAAHARGVYFRRRRRRLPVLLPVYKENGTGNLFCVFPQVFVHDLFITLPHERRKAPVFRAAEPTLRIPRRKFFDHAVRFHARFIAERTLGDDARAPAQHRPFERAAARKTFHRDPPAERMGDHARISDAERAKRFPRPIGVIGNRIRVRYLIRAAESRKIERGHAVKLRKIIYLRVKTFFGREIAVQHDKVFPLSFLQIRKSQQNSFFMTIASSSSG